MQESTEQTIETYNIDTHSTFSLWDSSISESRKIGRLLHRVSAAMTLPVIQRHTCATWSWAKAAARRRARWAELPTPAD